MGCILCVKLIKLIENDVFLIKKIKIIQQEVWVRWTCEHVICNYISLYIGL